MLDATPIPPELAPEEVLDPSEILDPPVPKGPPSDFVVSRQRSFISAEIPEDQQSQSHMGEDAGWDDSSDPSLDEPQTDVVSGRELDDDDQARNRRFNSLDGVLGAGSGESNRDVSALEPGDGSDAFDANRPRIRPPTDIFDVAPTVDRQDPRPADPSALDPGLDPGLDRRGSPSQVTEGVDRTETGEGPAGLVSGPVGRRQQRVSMSRSLFGVAQESRIPGDEPPQVLAFRPDGTVDIDAGVIRVGDDSEPTVTESADVVDVDLDARWCWIAIGRSARRVRVTVPAGSLVVQPGTRALVVVEADSSAFVSVVSGSASIEHPSGSSRMVAGSIAHLPVSGRLSIDRASPEEMAADPILTMNLRLDESDDRA